MRVYVNMATGEMTYWLFTALAWANAGHRIREYKEYPDELVLDHDWGEQNLPNFFCGLERLLNF